MTTSAGVFRSKQFGSNLPSQHSLGIPTAAYPGRVATNSDLMIAVDRQQTRLALPMNLTDTTMTVVDPSSIVSYNLLTIDNEIVKTTGAPSGNSIPITRGFDGTTPALHLAGATVSGFVDAWHHNALVAEIEAIEAALGANLANIPGATAFVLNGPFIFPPQSPGGSLIVGNNVVTLSPVPRGVNGTDTNHYLYISGGTGTAEAALITGGSAVAGAPSGTVIINCANAHSGAWTISTATGGIQEAIASLPAAGGLVLVTVNATMNANVYDMGKTQVAVWRMPGATLIDTGNHKIFYGFTLPYDREFIYQNYPPASAILYGGTRYDMGGYPDAYRFGGNNIPMTECLTGSICIPSTAGPRLGTFAGVAGYATTYYVDTTPPTNAAAVGVLGFATQPGPNGAIWGANFVITNAGNNVANSLMFGCEIDVNHSATAGRAASVMGCMIVNACTAAPSNLAQFIGISVRNQSTSNVQMTTAYESAIGVAAHALWVGIKNPVPNTASPSQDIYFQSCSGTINPACTMWMDQNGNLFIGLDEQDTMNVVQGGGVRIKPRTYGTLPIAPNLVEGIMCPITDCNTNVWGAVAGGGGSYHAMLYYNGAQWKVMCC